MKIESNGGMFVNILVVYDSEGGHTEALAKAIALGVEKTEKQQY